jgi:hypothetical protein
MNNITSQWNIISVRQKQEYKNEGEGTPQMYLFITKEFHGSKEGCHKELEETVALSGNRYYITDNIYERLALKLYLRI